MSEIIVNRKLIVRDIEDYGIKWWMTRTQYKGKDTMGAYSSHPSITRICYGIRDTPKLHAAYPNYYNNVKMSFEI